MGRSQLKYRPSRGRGQGDSGARGGRGHGSGADATAAGRSGKPKRSGGRALGSNAFRYEERDETETAGDGDEDASAARATPTRRQFFEGEQNYRDMGEAKESYFRTKAVQRWEAEDDADDDTATRAATSTVGVMDFAWIAAQLAAVPPSLRFQIDPKYCGDFTFEVPVDDERREPEVPDSVLVPTESSNVNPATGSTRVPATPSSGTPLEPTLDDLLALSASTAATLPAVPTPTPPQDTLTQLSASIKDGGQENLEDWLDDVLDM